jgi:hypothetical protein
LRASDVAFPRAVTTYRAFAASVAGEAFRHGLHLKSLHFARASDTGFTLHNRHSLTD